MSSPQLVVLDVVGSYAVLPTKMHQHDGRPNYLKVGSVSIGGRYPFLFLVAVEESGEGVYSYGVAS